MGIILCALLAVFIPELRAHARDAGVTSEPDIGLRVEQNSNAPVVATVKRRESFTYECETGGQWCKVTLRSGESGWLERAAIRYHFTEKDLPERDDPKNLSEIGSFTRRRGFNYDTTVRAAARGDAKALKRFYAISEDVDGAAAESHGRVRTRLRVRTIRFLRCLLLGPNSEMHSVSGSGDASSRWPQPGKE